MSLASSSRNGNDLERDPLEPSANKKVVTPLPKSQLAVLCLSSIAEPIAFSQIFPYINQMVEELHITDDQSKVGFYSGIVDSLFYVAQLLTIYQWGRLSDRIGRKPVIISGLLGVCMSSFLFGLSSSLGQMLVFRCMAGALSGNIAVIRSVFGEITDETNHSKAFPLGGVIYSVGMVIGPTIGGSLSHPAERYPRMFGKYPLLKEKPYFLPSLVSALITVFCIIITAIVLEESLPSRVTKRRQSDDLVHSRNGAAAGSPSSTVSVNKSYGSIVTPGSAGPSLETESPASLATLLSITRIRYLLLSTFLLNFTCSGFEVLFTLFSYTPIRLGGLSRTPSEIGIALAVIGVFGIPLSLFGFHLMHKIFGTLPLYRVLLFLYVIAILSMPLLSMLAWFSASQTPRVGPSASVLLKGLMWLAILLTLWIARVATTGFAANMILTKSCSPNAKSLGSMFALGQTVSGLARAISPALASSLYAISVQKHILGGHFVWIVMALIAYSSVRVTKKL